MAKQKNNSKLENSSTIFKQRLPASFIVILSLLIVLLQLGGIKLKGGNIFLKRKLMS